MTQEEKDLLLKDFCARLPYGVKVECSERGTIPVMSVNVTIPGKEYVNNLWEIESCKPYLRPMSSMTEEERKEYWSKCDTFTDPAGFTHYFKGTAAFDWLIQHHFDYRRLIEKGLALEAPEGMF